MADYYPVLTRAVSALDPNTAEARRAVYERARQAIVKQLRSYEPPLSESEITKERLGLEEAVRRIEAEARAGAARPGGGAARESGASEARSTAETPRPPAGSEGLTRVHEAAAAAASLGAATASAQAKASTARAAFEPPPAASQTASRAEPSFDRPRIPGPLPGDSRPPPGIPPLEPPGDRAFDDPNPHLREPEHFEEPRRRTPAVAALITVALVAALGVGAYFKRDDISAAFGTPDVTAPAPGPKVADRVEETTPVAPALPGDYTSAAPAASDQLAAAPSEPQPAAPTTPADPGTIVSQRAILYDEAPDKQGGAASNGAVVWRTEPVAANPSQTQLVGEVAVPERQLAARLVFTRNLDATLPASHVVEISFTLPPDFQNGGVGNVPGILFKPSEEAGGSALKGMSVKVTKNVFWIGLEASPADREQNLQAIRTRGWIDVPILYENGRRAVLTLEKGTPGERAFEAAFAAWEASASAGAAGATAPP